MYENAISTQKISLKKKFILAWILVAVLLVIFSGLAALKYSKYYKAQQTAVALTLAASDEFDQYKNDYKKLVSKMYRFFNPTPMNVTVKGVKIDNSAAVKAAREADRTLGKLLDDAGYSCYYGSTYLEYIGFVDYTTHNSSGVYYIIWGVLAVALLIANLLYAADHKKVLILEGDRVVFMKGKKVAKEFMARDVRSIQQGALKSLTLRGQGINCTVNFVQNAQQVTEAVMAVIASFSGYAPAPYGYAPNPYAPPQYAAPNTNPYAAPQANMYAPNGGMHQQPVRQQAVPQQPVRQQAVPQQPVRQQAAPRQPDFSTIADTLIRYQELLAQGKITQEQFDALKKQLLDV